MVSLVDQDDRIVVSERAQWDGQGRMAWPQRGCGWVRDEGMVAKEKDDRVDQGGGDGWKGEGAMGWTREKSQWDGMRREESGPDQGGGSGG